MLIHVRHGKAFLKTAVLLALGMGLELTANSVTNWTVVGWNNLGMHCMDGDYSVFSILPPYNTINVQLVGAESGTTWLAVGGTNCGITYSAVADPDGSLNTSSSGKTDFFDYVLPLFGLPLPVDTGLPVPGPNSFVMPGVSNRPQAMSFVTNFNWYVAYGIPITPYDDAGRPNQYPMMRLTSTNPVATLKTTDIVLPVSDEMNCRLCHLSDSVPAAQPAAGWVDNPHPAHDYRLNVLRLHDEHLAGNPLFHTALTNASYNPNGLYATVIITAKPVLCARCHGSEALPGSGYPGIPPLTRAVHASHAGVVDPRNGMTLDNSSNRMACYSCHPGSLTRCLRGAMGKAVAADGTMAMQCQSCHGSMTMVGATNRTGWLMEPNCQACHTGNALVNAGAIRFVSVFTNGALRVPTNTLFATTPDTPAPDLSLFRFSRGHGGLACSACHGSTHAEFPTSSRNDNIQSLAIQGHEGVLSECVACHQVSPATVAGGPHGLHPVGAPWVSAHPTNANSSCRSCHGLSYQGTELSRCQAKRTMRSQVFWRGRKVSCFECHNGSSGDGSAPVAPAATNVAASTQAGVPVILVLQGSTNSFRIVSQPSRGTVALSGNLATYYPDISFGGTDQFTFAAASAVRESNLATGTVVVAIVDSVGDGIPDWWRKYYFGGDGKTTNGQSCVTADPDGDSMNNLAEYTAGNNPLDYRSVVRVFAFSPTGGSARLHFTSELGQEFALERSVDLGLGGWTNIHSNVWGRLDATSVTDGSLSNKTNKAFYRIRVMPYTKW